MPIAFDEILLGKSEIYLFGGYAKTHVVYLGKGYFEWDTARLKHSLQKRRNADEKEED